MAHVLFHCCFILYQLIKENMIMQWQIAVYLNVYKKVTCLAFTGKNVVHIVWINESFKNCHLVYNMIFMLKWNLSDHMFCTKLWVEWFEWFDKLNDRDRMGNASFNTWYMILKVLINCCTSFCYLNYFCTFITVNPICNIITFAADYFH